jgi:anthranilate synthase component 1
MQRLVANNPDCNLFPLYAELNADMETPVSAFLKVKRGNQSFLLESVEGGEQIARYSFIGTEPFKLIEQSTFTVVNGEF